jgi:hypothetical protein
MEHCISFSLPYLNLESYFYRRISLHLWISLHVLSIDWLKNVQVLPVGSLRWRFCLSTVVFFLRWDCHRETNLLIPEHDQNPWRYIHNIFKTTTADYFSSSYSHINIVVFSKIRWDAFSKKINRFYLLAKTLKLCGFPIFWLKFIPETHAHCVRNVRFYHTLL